MAALGYRDWTEPVIDPLDLTYEQMFKFQATHCEGVIWEKPTPEYNSGWIVYCEAASPRPFKANTLHKAVCAAAAAFKEVNGELKI